MEEHKKTWKTLRQIMDFFETYRCEVTAWETRSTWIFDIWSYEEKRFILQDANETQFRNFYELVKNKKK